MAGKLEGDRGLARLEREAAQGLDDPATRQWVQAVIVDAAEQDRQFETAVLQAVSQVQAALESGGVSVIGNGAAVAGSQTIIADHGSLAAGGALHVDGSMITNPLPGRVRATPDRTRA